MVAFVVLNGGDEACQLLTQKQNEALTLHEKAM